MEHVHHDDVPGEVTVPRRDQAQARAAMSGPSASKRTQIPAMEGEAGRQG